MWWNNIFNKSDCGKLRGRQEVPDIEYIINLHVWDIQTAKYMIYCRYRSRCSVSLGLDITAFEAMCSLENLSSPYPYRPVPDAPTLLCSGYSGSFPGVKRQQRGVDHPPHLTPRWGVKNTQSVLHKILRGIHLPLTFSLLSKSLNSLHNLYYKLRIISILIRNSI